MDSDIDAESDMSLLSRSFLHRVNDRARMIQDHSSKDATQDSHKHSFFWGECSCLQHWKHLYSWERITQTICMPSKIQEISKWNRCSTKLRNCWPHNQMRAMEGTQLFGLILHGNIYLWLMAKKSSVSRAQRFTYFQILCYSLERWARTHYQKFSGRTNWRGSKIHHNTDLWTQLMVSQWNSSGIFPRIHHIAALQQSPRVHVKKWAKSQNNLLDGSSSCQCSTTSHRNFKKISENANQAPNSFRLMQKDFHREDGHSSDLDQKRRGILLLNVNHKENGTELQSWWC